jgi:translation elongation factor EF-Ts
MANFTIADVKALREQLGTGLTDTKKALEEADGDRDKAVELLRLKGAKGNAKRADRSADEETAHGLAQHIAFANPSYLNREDVPQDDIDRERKVVEDITRAEGKPEAALPKIVEGRLGAYFKQIVLNEQEYARDPKFTVKQIAENAGLTIVDFARLKVGAGVETADDAE